MTTPPPTNPLPPELASDRDRAEAAQDHGINDDDCRKHGEPLYSGWCKACAADAIRQAREDALLAADVPGLLAEIERLRTEQADNLRAAQSIAAELVAQREEARAALAAQSRTLAEKAQQVESLRAELSEMGDAGVEKVRELEAELEGVRERLAKVDAALPDTWYGGAYTDVRVGALVRQWQKIYPIALHAEDFRARVEAEFNELIRLASPLGATVKEIKAAHKRLSGGMVCARPAGH